MALKKEWVGKRFGKLRVVAETDPNITPSGNKTRRFICKCDCGNTVTVLRSELASGRTSCGCERYDKLRIDLTGQRFGRLVVQKRVELDKPLSNGTITGWLCRCDCGNEIVYSTKALRNDKIVSCGCALRDSATAKIVEQNVVGHFDGTTISTISPERKANKNSRTGVKGVYWSNSEGCYIAKIGFKGKNITLGRFQSLAAATVARKAAEDEYYKPEIEKYHKEVKPGG